MDVEKMIPSFDGTKLYFRKDVPESPRAVIVIAHGLHEHLGRYDHFAEKLNETGIATYRYDQRGHGRSEGPRVFFHNYDEIVDDLNVVVETALRENPGLPVFVFGHSMGGFAATLFGTKYPKKANGIILSGAMTRYNKPTMGKLPIDEPADTYHIISLGGGICSDPEMNRAHQNDPLVDKRVSVGLVNTIYYGVEWLKENAKQFVDPVLILHGCCDGPVSEKDSRDLFGEIGSEDKTLKIYAFLFHELLNEPCRDEIIAEIMAWLNKRVSV